MKDDAELLHCYAESREDAAFAELVGRHIDFVYSAALRQVNGDAHLAQDVTQSVFTDLARKSGQLAEHRVLAGWLFTSTRFAAAKAVRGEQRRRVRDREAQLMNEILREDPAEKREWENVRPVIDEALAQLGEADREAVLLRFFEGRNFASVGAKLRLTENAARMRVERALDKLQQVMRRRGVASTTGALAAALATQAVTAAPAGMAASVAGAALSGVVTAAGTTSAVLTFMGMTKLQLGIAAAVAVIGGVEIVTEQKANAALRAEVAALAPSVDLTALRAERVRQTRLADEVAELKRDDAELARLGEAADALKREIQAREQAVTLAEKSRREAPRELTGEIFDLSKLDQKPEAKFQAKPSYPFELRNVGMEGEAIVDFVVDAEGQVRNARAIRSTHPEFGDAAIEAVKQWTFLAGQKGGRAVNAHMQVPIVFTLAKKTVTPGNWF